MTTSELDGAVAHLGRGTLGRFDKGTLSTLPWGIPNPIRRKSHDVDAKIGLDERKWANQTFYNTEYKFIGYVFNINGELHWVIIPTNNIDLSGQMCFLTLAGLRIAAKISLLLLLLYTSEKLYDCWL